MSPGRRLAAGLSAGPGALALLLLVEAWIARAEMRPCFVDPSREVVVQGWGPRLVYAVLGDSTGAGQGAPYQQGIAMATARHLARTHTVELTNLSASGATLVEVLAIKPARLAVFAPTSSSSPSGPTRSPISPSARACEHGSSSSSSACWRRAATRASS